MTWDVGLVGAASAALDHAADPHFHTVGAAVRDATGQIHAGVNLFHFTGGPCAEMVALANTAGATPVRIVAVGDGDRGVLPPCGRCRQILLDLHPGIEIMLPGHEVRTPGDLLPLAYRWSEGKTVPHGSLD